VHRRVHDRSPPADQPKSRLPSDGSPAAVPAEPRDATRGELHVPRTRAEASRLIDELRRRPVDSAADRRRDVRAVQDAMATGRGDAARVREELEVTGYGASATWKGGRS